MPNIGSYIKIIDNTGARAGRLIKILKRRTRIGPQSMWQKHAKKIDAQNMRQKNAHGWVFSNVRLGSGGKIFQKTRKFYK
jgi:ribosomal protein L14